MLTLMAAGLVLTMTGIALAGEPMVHEGGIEHGGQALTVRYVAKPVVKLREIGTRTPNRPATSRCVWTASLDVQREVVGAAGVVAAFDKRFVGGETVKGSRPGSCVGAREAIEVAAKAQLNAEARLAAAAAADRATLTAELDSVGPR